MRPGRAVERRLERRAVDEKRGERVRLRRKRGHENPHTRLPLSRSGKDGGPFHMVGSEIAEHECRMIDRSGVNLPCLANLTIFDDSALAMGLTGVLYLA